MITDKRMFIGLTIFMICVSSNVYSSDKIYTTNFPFTESRISEGGNKWINGGATGIDWINVMTANGRVFGAPSPGTPKYKDPTAILGGIWGADQTAEAVVFSQNKTNAYFQEVELRLRTNISANSITGYEVGYRCLDTDEAYVFLARWNGPFQDLSALWYEQGAQYGVQNGDTVRAEIQGNTIKMYKNNVLLGTVVDDTYSSGNPGIGFNYGVEATNVDFGFTSFKATAPETRVPKSPSIISIR